MSDADCTPGREPRSVAASSIYDIQVAAPLCIVHGTQLRSHWCTKRVLSNVKVVNVSVTLGGRGE